MKSLFFVFPLSSRNFHMPPRRSVTPAEPRIRYRLPGGATNVDRVRAFKQVPFPLTQALLVSLASPRPTIAQPHLALLHPCRLPQPPLGKKSRVWTNPFRGRAAMLSLSPRHPRHPRSVAVLRSHLQSLQWLRTKTKT